jgi:hypothetical protein
VYDCPTLRICRGDPSAGLIPSRDATGSSPAADRHFSRGAAEGGRTMADNEFHDEDESFSSYSDEEAEWEKCYVF